MLSEQEQELMELLGQVATGMYEMMLPFDSGTESDYAEAVHYIHGLQNMVLAQAAARLYPDKYRLYGRQFP